MIRTMKFSLDHMKLVQSIAWSFHFTTGLLFEDLYSEACLHYCEGMKEYDSNKRRAKRTTYLYRYITHMLIFYIRNENRRRDIIWEMECRKEEYQHTPHYEFYRDYPPDVQTIMDFIQESNGEISDIPPKLARGVVFRELIKRGWTHRRSWDAIREIKKLVREIEIHCII